MVKQGQNGSMQFASLVEDCRNQKRNCSTDSAFERKVEEMIVELQSLERWVNTMHIFLRLGRDMERECGPTRDQGGLEAGAEPAGQDCLDIFVSAVGPIMQEHIEPVTQLVGHMGNHLEGVLKRVLGLGRKVDGEKLLIPAGSAFRAFKAGWARSG